MTTLHPKTLIQLESLRASPSGSVIFHGRRGIGKATAARELACSLNCLADNSAQCVPCRQIMAGNFPDFIWVDKGDKASISIELIRSLITSLSLRPYRTGSLRVVVIDEAHLLTVEAQNALLKLLEEPPPATLVILLAEYVESLLITVRSRCRLVAFPLPGRIAVEAMLVTTKGLPGQVATQLAAASGGLPGVAINLAEQPAQAQALMELTKHADTVTKLNMFSRLILAAKLISSGADLIGFSDVLHRRFVIELTDGDLTGPVLAVRLNALERFRTQLRAKVSARVALERLMLELG